MGSLLVLQSKALLKGMNGVRHAFKLFHITSTQRETQCGGAITCTEWPQISEASPKNGLSNAYM